jgi:hypothetical protein
MANRTKFAGMFNAIDYNYGGTAPGGSLPPGFTVSSPAVPSGVQTLLLETGLMILTDGSSFGPLATNAPVLVGGGSNQETVTPTSVTNNGSQIYNTAGFTANFANAHGTGDPVASATFGLQEALNACLAYGGGLVIVDASWGAAGGTTAMITAATIPAGVTLSDNRTGGFGGGLYMFNVALTNAQVKATNSAPPSTIAAPGAGNGWQIIDMTLENKYLTAAFANGGALALYYGTDSTGVLGTATVAATFLTSPTANEIITVAGALAANLSSAIVNKGLVLANPTADFITGAGSMVVRVTARLLTGL